MYDLMWIEIECSVHFQIEGWDLVLSGVRLLCYTDYLNHSKTLLLITIHCIKVSVLYSGMTIQLTIQHSSMGLSQNTVLHSSAMLGTLSLAEVQESSHAAA